MPKPNMQSVIVGTDTYRHRAVKMSWGHQCQELCQKGILLALMPASHLPKRNSIKVLHKAHSSGSQLLALLEKSLHPKREPGVVQPYPSSPVSSQAVCLVPVTPQPGYGPELCRIPFSRLSPPSACGEHETFSKQHCKEKSSNLSFKKYKEARCPAYDFGRYQTNTEQTIIW